MVERDIIMGDILFCLKHGYVNEEPENSTQFGFFKYKVTSKTPNSGSNLVDIVIIPDFNKKIVKITLVTVIKR